MLDVQLIKVSLTDESMRKNIFFVVAILNSIQNGGWEPRYQVLTS